MAFTRESLSVRPWYFMDEEKMIFLHWRSISSCRFLTNVRNEVISLGLERE